MRFNLSCVTFHNNRVYEFIEMKKGMRSETTHCRIGYMLAIHESSRFHPCVNCKDKELLYEL